MAQGTPEGVEDNGSLTRVAAFPIGIDPERFARALDRSDVKAHIAQLLNRYAGRKVSATGRGDVLCRRRACIDSPGRRCAHARPRCARTRQGQRQQPGPGAQVMLGVDRLDMIKGIPQKLLAFEKFLEEHPEWRDKVLLVQIAVPSRTDVPEYQARCPLPFSAWMPALRHPVPGAGAACHADRHMRERC